MTTKPLIEFIMRTYEGYEFLAHKAGIFKTFHKILQKKQAVPKARPNITLSIIQILRYFEFT